MGTTEYEYDKPTPIDEPTALDLFWSEQACAQYGCPEGVAAVAVAAPSAYISIKELADALHVSEWKVRDLLNRDLIPRAYRMTPGLAKSTWVIPASAPSLYLAQFARVA